MWKWLQVFAGASTTPVITTSKSSKSYGQVTQLTVCMPTRAEYRWEFLLYNFTERNSVYFNCKISETALIIAKPMPMHCFI